MERLDAATKLKMMLQMEGKLPPTRAKRQRRTGPVVRATYHRPIDVQRAIRRATRWARSADRVAERNTGMTRYPPAHIAEKLGLAKSIAGRTRR